MSPLLISTEGGGKVQLTMLKNRDPESRVNMGGSFKFWPTSRHQPDRITWDPRISISNTGFRSFRPCRAYREVV